MLTKRCFGILPKSNQNTVLLPKGAPKYETIFDQGTEYHEVKGNRQIFLDNFKVFRDRLKTAKGTTQPSIDFYWDTDLSVDRRRITIRIKSHQSQLVDFADAEQILESIKTYVKRAGCRYNSADFVVHRLGTDAPTSTVFADGVITVNDISVTSVHRGKKFGSWQSFGGLG